MNALLISNTSFGTSLAGSVATNVLADSHEAVRTGSVASGGSNTGATDLARGARLSLTRRGRLVFFGIPTIAAAALILFVSLAIMAGSFASPANAAAEAKTVNMADYAVAVTVLQGDSLWSIASAADPTRDVRHVVREIVALNDLGTGVLQAGQRLYVPTPK